MKPDVIQDRLEQLQKDTHVEETEKELTEMLTFLVKSLTSTLTVQNHVLEQVESICKHTLGFKLDIVVNMGFSAWRIMDDIENKKIPLHLKFKFAAELLSLYRQLVQHQETTEPSTPIIHLDRLGVYQFHLDGNVIMGEKAKLLHDLLKTGVALLK